MNSRDWPNYLRGTDEPAVAWLNKLRAASLASQLKDVKFTGGGTAKLLSGTDGQTLVLTTPQVNVEADAFMFPFKIYQIANATDSGLDAFTFQIRDGLVGFRPQYVYPNINILGMNILAANGNWEFALAATGTDGLADSVFGSNITYTNPSGPQPDFSKAASTNFGGSVIVSQADGSTNPVLIRSNDPALGEQDPVQIVLQPNPGSDPGQVFQGMVVSFFIKIIDAPTGCYTELWASQYNVGGAGFRNPFFAKAYPNPDQTLAVGFIIANTDGTFTISQSQVGHLMNRYLEKIPKPSNDSGSFTAKFFGIAQVNRGLWTANALSGKIFYPGDVVVDDTHQFSISTTFPTGIFTAYKSFIHVNDAINVETVVPTVGGNWRGHSIVLHA